MMQLDHRVRRWPTERRPWMRRFLLGALTLPVLLPACTRAGDRTEAPQHAAGSNRDTLALRQPLPPGRAEAFFTIGTGGDQFTERPVEAKLIVIVRVERTEYRQTIATCRAPGLGSALGGGTKRELEVAMCDGEYWLVTEPGTVLVVRMDQPRANTPVAQFALASGVVAVSPAIR